MSKTTLKILQSGIGISLFVLFLSWAFRPAEAASVDDNIEALNWNEMKLEDICTKAGGVCKLDRNNILRGVSIED